MFRPLPLFFAALAAAFLAASAATPLAALAPTAPVPEDAKKPLYFPVTKGTRWTYEWNDTRKKEVVEVVDVITEVEDGEDGAKLVTLARIGSDGRVFRFHTNEVSDRGVFWTKNHVGMSPRSPWCELKLPHKDGQTWNIDPMYLKVTMTARGPEKVTVPAGEFSCIRVEQRDDRSPDPQITRFYAPEVGLVKLTTDDLTITLKKFTPGKN